jgi:hypothetical protein
MKIATYEDFDHHAPNDVQQLRKQSIQAHRLHGQPVVLKSRFTERDVEAGIAVHCPYDHDEAIGQGRQWDPYCFGTGYLGGFADGVVTFITLVDAAIDKVKIDREGALYLEQAPQIIAPYKPTIGTGDLIITGLFSPNNWDIIEEEDRYLIGDVTPTTLRGHPQFPKRFITQQVAQATLLPRTHELYQVPVEFDFNNLPTPPDPAPGHDPDPITPTPPTNDTEVADEDVSIVLPTEE